MTSSHLLVAFLLGFVTMKVTSSSLSDVTGRCPAHCRCVATTRTADCRDQQLTEIESTVDQLDSSTEVLDLRNNQLTTIRSHSFSTLTNLSTILLDDNIINDVQQYAFQGLHNIRFVSLTRNRLTTIHSNSFSDMSGSEDLCSHSSRNESTYCTLDLTENNVVSIERNAFAWIQRLQIRLGRADVAMTIGAYAFYGARLIPRVEVGRVPALILKPRIFTNTEDVLSVDVADTAIGQLDKFVFEGLKNVDKIKFTNVALTNVQSFAFSGIQFRRHHHHVPAVTGADVNITLDGRAGVQQHGIQNTDSNNRSRRKKSRVERYTHSGGMVSFANCQLELIQTDAFRDTNVAHIEIITSRIGNIEKRAFQAVVGLQSLRIVGSHFVSNRLTTDSFASLRGLQNIELVDNDFSIVEPFALRDVIDIDTIFIRFRSSEATLMTEAFGHVSDVDELRLSGNVTSSNRNSRRTHLEIHVGAFRNLVGVEHMRIEHFRLAAIKRHTFAGLSRIANLTVAYCDVTTIEKEAFGDSASHVGAIEQFDVGTGNRLNCDCSVGSLLREFEIRFTSYTAYCYANEDRPEGTVRTLIPIQHGALQSVNIACSAASIRTVASVSKAILAVVFAGVMLSIFQTR